MSGFKLSDSYDKNKIFFINLSELKGRIDPYFYKNEFNIIEEKLSKIKYTNFKFASKKIFSGITPKSKGNAYTTIDKGVAFVRSGDFSQDNIISFSKLNYIKPEIHNKLMKNSKLQKNDLMIAIVGATIGKVGVYNYDREANINQAICAIRFKDDFLSNFIHIYLLTSLGQKIIDRLKRPVARANINLDEISSIPLPILKLEKQKSIVDFYYSQIENKQKKEEQAKDLLDSIDDYLLDELGITLPEVDNSLENRMFEINFSKVSGGRLDAPSNTKKFIFNSIYYLEYFDHLLFIDPHIRRVENEILCTFLPMEKISDIYGEANLCDKKYYSQSNGYTKFQDNDLLWSKITPCMENGKSAVVENLENKIGFGSTEYYVFRTKTNNMNIKYIHAFLRLNILRTEAKRFFSGSAGHQRVSKEFFKSLQIPLPPMQKQNEIVTHIQILRDNAKQLKLEAIQDLENAKQEVEKMILGE